MPSPYALDFNPLASAIESNQQYGLQKNRLAMDEKRLGFESERLGFERSLHPMRLEGAKLDIERNRTMLPLDVERARQGVDRERSMLPLDIQGKRTEIAGRTQDIEGKRRELEKDLYGRAAAIGQMIEGEPDPEKQRAMLKRFYDADPAIRQGLAGKLPAEVMDDPLVAARYMRAVHAGYQAPQTMKVAKDESLIVSQRDPNNPAAPPKVNEVYRNPGKGEEFKDEHQLRGELAQHPTVKNFADIKAGYGRMIEGDKLKTGAGDLAIVYGYMKMLDPTSVVREGEFATAEKTAGVPEQVRVLYNKILNGERLSEAVRTNFVGASGNIYARSLGDVEKINDQYRVIARRYKLNPDNIILDHGIAKPPERPGERAAAPFAAPPAMRDVVRGGVDKPAKDRLPPSRPTNAAEYNALPSGAEYVAPDGSIRTKR